MPACPAHQSPCEVWTIIIHCFVGRKKSHKKDKWHSPKQTRSETGDPLPHELAGFLLPVTQLGV